MPTIGVSLKDVCGLIGKEMTQEQFKEALSLTKCSHESMIGEELMIEVTSDRPDLLSAEGIARELKGLLGIETGLRRFKVAGSDVTLRIDRSVLDVRPYMSSAVLEGLNLSDEAVRQIMQLQEKIHMTYGRNRRTVSIGVHDLDTVSHDLTYAAVDPEKISFVPLDETRPMNGNEVLQLTPKGKEYGYIIKGFPRYPLLYDSNGRVLSLPPIINGVLTRVTDHTKNLLLDVTGTNKALVDHALTLMTTALAERGAKIRSVKVSSPQGEERTPNLMPRIWKLRTETIQEVLGIELTSREIAHQLRKMRYGVRAGKKGVLTVVAPAYRKDLLHEVDIAEDVAIAYGYDRLEPTVPFTPTIGRTRKITVFTELIRDLMIGLGFQEIISFVMTSSQILFEKMNLQADEVVEVENPISVEYSVLRNRLLPGILSFLSYNRHVTYPQRVFECGDVVVIDKKTPTGCVNQRRLSGAISDYTVSYEDIQTVLYSLMDNLRMSGWSVERLEHPSFIQGRAATIRLHGSEIGILGEINPTILEQFGLENPAAAFEIDIEKIMSERADKRVDNNP